jgi:hypothetical protein
LVCCWAYCFPSFSLRPHYIFFFFFPFWHFIPILSFVQHITSSCFDRCLIQQYPPIRQRCYLHPIIRIHSSKASFSVCKNIAAHTVATLKITRQKQTKTRKTLMVNRQPQKRKRKLLELVFTAKRYLPFNMPSCLYPL